jgi:hypothetical protein
MKSLKANKSKLLKNLDNAVPFALLLSVMFFGIDFYRNDSVFEKTVNSLKKIEQSLTTRHIGIFPNYLDDINLLLAESLDPKHEISRVVIFEDVLFYGAFYSNGSPFKRMVHLLSDLSNKPGSEVIIAYYDNSKDWRNGQMFREVVQESWMRKEDLSELSRERTEILESLQIVNSEIKKSNSSKIQIADSIASEKFFAMYRDNEREEFSKRRKEILIPFYDTSKKDDWLFKRIDEITNSCLNKPENSITYHDIYTMYYLVTEELKSFFSKNHIRLIPLNSYLSMTCWSNGKEALFALPGRFAADEIGFISHDPAILYYIETMLNGVDIISINLE